MLVRYIPDDDDDGLGAILSSAEQAVADTSTTEPLTEKCESEVGIGSTVVNSNDEEK
jgi:hypothetical protein